MKNYSAYLASVPTPALMTAEELLEISIPGKQTELVRGHLVVREPPGLRHTAIASELGARLRDFARANKLGLVVAGEAGFTLSRNPDTVRAPDAFFIRADRVPKPLPKGYSDIVPDLAVEVLSPNDRAGEVLEKVGDWLNAGCEIVWVIDPELRMARVCRADGSESLVSDREALDGEAVLPGFSCLLGGIL